jgi:hypothetical protein
MGHSETLTVALGKSLRDQGRGELDFALNVRLRSGDPASLPASDVCRFRLGNRPLGRSDRSVPEAVHRTAPCSQWLHGARKMTERPGGRSAHRSLINSLRSIEHVDRVRRREGGPVFEFTLDREFEIAWEIV